MSSRTIQQVLHAAKPNTAERAFIISCLHAAVSYCESQYVDSDIDWMPSADSVGIEDARKFDLLAAFLDRL